MTEAGLAGGAAAKPAVGRLLRRLADRRQTLAVVESLTGGELAAAIVDVPGASEVFRGGLVVYATDLKQTLAGVSAQLLASRGPVDPAVALALARGGRETCHADWSLATTGVAGPQPQAGVPVGTAYVAVAGPVPSVDPAGSSVGAGQAPVAQVRALALRGDRAAVRRATVAAALALLAEQLDRSIGEAR